MATRRLFRRKSLNGAVVDVQTRLSVLETRPARTSLLANAVSPSNIYGGGIGYTWLEPYLQAQLNETINQANEGAIAASGLNMTYLSTTDPSTTVRTITKHQLSLKTATITTSAPHGYFVGSSVTLNYTPDNATFEGQHLVTAVPTPTTFQFTLPDSIVEIPETVVTTGVVTLNIRNGDIWKNPEDRNTTKQWSTETTPAGWVGTDLVVDKNDETASRVYNTVVRPNNITEALSKVKIEKGIVTITTATSHGFEQGDRIRVTGFTGSYIAANRAPAYIAEVNGNEISYKIEDTTKTLAEVSQVGSATYYLVDNDVWKGPGDVTWLWSSAANDFVKKQDVEVKGKTQDYSSTFDPVAPINLASYSVTNGVMTVTVATQHAYLVGSKVLITSGSNPELDNGGSEYAVVSVAGPITDDGNGLTFVVNAELEDSADPSITGTVTLVPVESDTWSNPALGRYKQRWNSTDGAWEPFDTIEISSPSEGSKRTYTTTSDPYTASWTIDKVTISKGTVSVLMLTTTTLTLEDRINVSGTGGGVGNSTSAIISEFTSSSNFKYKITDATISTPVLGVSGGTVTYRILEGDEWINPTNNERKEWRSGAWVTLTDPVAVTAQSTAAAAQTTANGKNTVYHATTLPNGVTNDSPSDALQTITGGTANTAGDIWYHYGTAGAGADKAGIILTQWQGTGGTNWTRRRVGTLTIANIDAGKITAGDLTAGRYIRAKSITNSYGIEMSASEGALKFINNSNIAFGGLYPYISNSEGTGISLKAGDTDVTSEIWMLDTDGTSSSVGTMILRSTDTNTLGDAQIFMTGGWTIDPVDPLSYIGLVWITGEIRNENTYKGSSAGSGTTGERFVKVDSNGKFFSVPGSAVSWSGGTVPNFSNFQAGLRSGDIIIGTSVVGLTTIKSATGSLTLRPDATTDSLLLENLPSGAGQASGGFLLAQASGSDRVIRRRLGFSSGTSTSTPPSLSWTPSTGDIYLIHEA